MKFKTTVSFPVGLTLLCVLRLAAPTVFIYVGLSGLSYNDGFFLGAGFTGVLWGLKEIFDTLKSAGDTE